MKNLWNKKTANDYIKKYGKKVRFSSPQSIEIILSTSVWSEIFNCLRDVLNILQGSTTPSLQ